MARKIYKRIGLRRDKNFSDLSDAKTSLNNLLDGLVEDKTRESFISEDLNAIRNVSNIGLKVSEYRQVIGSTINFTTSDGDNREYTPHITFQNRLDQFKVFSGNPRIGGGNGLDARYWQKDQILVNENEIGPKFDLNVVGAAHAGKDDNGTNNSNSDIFTGTTSLGTIPPDQFWEQGNFDYSGKIHPQSVFTDGGVKWEGYFIPIRPGRHNFSIHTTAFCTIDFEQENYAEDANGNQTADSVTLVGAGNTFKSWWRVGLGTELSCSASGAGNNITIPAYKSRHIGIGMSVRDNNGNIKFTTDPNGNVIWPKVEAFTNSATNSTVNVTLTPVSGETESVNGSFTNNNVEFFRNYGDEISMYFSTHFLKEFEKYKVRFRYFFPRNIDSLGMTRRIEFNWRPPTGGDFGNLRYTKLFSPDYDFSDSVKGTFNKFFDTSVRFGGTDWTGIGPTSGTDDYIKISSSNKVESKYIPPRNYSEILKATNSFNITTGSDVLAMDGGTTGGIEIGNYIFPADAADTTSIPEGARVIDIQINNAIIIDKPCDATKSLSCIFINHRGFVKRMLTKGKGASTYAVDVQAPYKTKHSCTKWGKEIRKYMLVIQKSPQINKYSYVDSVTNDTEFVMNDHSGSRLQSSAWVMTYFYQRRGLVDLSLDYYCGRRNFTTYGSGITNYPGDLDATVGTAAKCKMLVGGTTAPVSQLTLVNRDNINVGDKIEGFGIPTDTEIGSFPNGSSSPYVVTLVDNNGDPVSTEENTTDGASVTVSSGNVSKQLCCPPTDTSPPFAATLDGLQTTATNKYLFMSGGNIIFDNLKFRFPSNAFTDSTIANRKIFKYNRNTTDDSTISQEYCTRKISLKTPGVSGNSSGNFTILCTTGN